MIVTKQKPLVAAMLSVTILSSSGCSTISKNTKMALGCVIGTLGGAAVGALVGRGDVTRIAGGAIVGAIAGCGVGYYLQEREKKLAEEAEQSGFKSEFVRIKADKKGGASFSKTADDDTVLASQITLTTDKPLFRSGQSRITDSKQLINLDKFIKAYIKGMDASSQIYIVGHTDASGNKYFNQKLSEKRAKFIAYRFAKYGAPKNKIFFEGVGENQPIATNNTKEGRAKNRRFEILDIFDEKLTNKKSVSLEQVIRVSEAKKQRINNVMNEQGLAIVSGQTQPREQQQSNITDKSNSIITLPRSTKTKLKTTRTTKVVDRNPLQLDGILFDQQRSSEELTDTLGVYHDEGFHIFAQANAAPAFIDSCAVSEPKVSSKVKTLGDDTKYSKTSEYLPGMIGNNWFRISGIDGKKTMVLLGPVRVRKDTFESEGTPHFSFYKNYSSHSQRPNYRTNLHVETYRGNHAVLYRVYPTQKTSLFKCADFVLSTNGKLVTKRGEIIYNSNKNTLSKSLNLRTKL